MSNTDNPFQAPQYRPPMQPSFDTPFPPPKPGSVVMEYMRVYNYIFENPNWFMNLVLLAVCQLIPIVGPIVGLGYQFFVVEALHRRTHVTYPDFDFNRFGDYLLRGVWPFLVSLIVAMILVPLFYAVMIVGVLVVAGAAAAAGPDWGGVVGGVLGLIMFFGLFAFGLGLNFVIQPMFLRAGLSQDFGQAFNFSFVKDFCARVWKEMLAFWLFVMVTGMLVALAGFVACFVGMYVAIAVLILAQAHGLFQLYELHLSRGGMPIPLKTEVPRYAG